MRIEHNYLKEYFDEFHASSPASPEDAAQPGLSFIPAFMQSLAESREKFRAEKRAEGLCMSVSEYKEMAEAAENLAEIYDMDFLADQNNGRALLVLTCRGFDLCRDETPERVEAFARLIARSDRFFLSPVFKYGHALFEIALFYDLDE